MSAPVQTWLPSGKFIRFMSAKENNTPGPSNGALQEGRGRTAAASSPRAEPATDQGLIVGIGASAGGLEAYRSFLSCMPADSGMAFVLVQHLAPDHKSMLAELLGKVTTMKVVEATNGMAVTANHVFVIPPDATMTIQNRNLKVDRPAPPREHRRPIDSFMESLARDQGENAISIILSGTGSDGTLGLTAIKEHGGFTLAQAEFDSHAMAGMPQSAASTGQVDDVLAVEDMPARLIGYSNHLNGVAGSKDGEGVRHDAVSHLTTIMGALRARSGHDFSQYKEKTLVRRLQRRMQVLEIETPAAYIERFRAQPEELDLLFRELLIGVTHFFRDPASFEALDELVLKGLVADKGADDEIRIWVPGCATGQEAFTIAILLREAMDRRRPQPKVQIFATDIDERAIEIARKGRFRGPIAGLSSDRAERWFTKDGGGFCVIPEIREMCIFSTHSVIKHPPFSRLDLVSCRNLLIYLDAPMQDRVMKTFHYALKPGGSLFLGSSESVTRSTRLFSVVDKKHRIFVRRATEGAALPDFSAAGGEVGSSNRDTTALSINNQIDKSARRLMEQHYPPHVVVDARHQIVRFSGGAIGPYLEPAAGAPSFALFDILRRPLRSPVRAALQEAQSTGAPVRHEAVLVRLDKQLRRVTLIVEPMVENGQADYFVLAFQDAGLGAAPASDVVGSHSTAKVQALEQELLSTRTQLQSTIDELEVTNEEMKSSNEEYQSVNEEFQSSNEELETAKEEMQSINEEIQTVNAEMTSKNEQLSLVNSDLKNLLESTEVATLFLDEHLRVRNFTRGLTDIFHLRDTDVGRPITEIVSLLEYSELKRDVAKVLRDLGVIERQVTLKDAGMTFILRLRPYRTIDNVIAGVVLTFLDITMREAGVAALRETQNYLRLLIDSVADAIYCIDTEGKTTLCNAAFLKMIGFADHANVVGLNLHDTINHSRPDGSPYLEDDCPICRTAKTGEFSHRDDETFFRVDGSSIPVEYWTRPIIHGGELKGAVCTFVDVTERRRADDQQSLLLKEMGHRVNNLFSVVNGVVTLSAASAPTVKDLAKTILGRLGALSRAHQLVRSNDSGATIAKQRTSLGELIRTILVSHVDLTKTGADARATIEGPEVEISGPSIISIALVIHELATNAAKYGAFSNADGCVDVVWLVENGCLELTWGERGGPAIGGPPKSEGFGSQLARTSVSGQLNGKLTFDWNPDGLIVHMSAAMEQLTP
ncbi:MAG: chemotaxis protein CheB [Novosphingobium sp.]